MRRDELDELMEKYGHRLDAVSKTSFRGLYNTSLEFYYSDGISDDYNYVHAVVKAHVLAGLRIIGNFDNFTRGKEQPI